MFTAPSWLTFFIPVVFTAPSVANVQSAIEEVYPLVSEFRKERTPEEEARRTAAHLVHFNHEYDHGARDNTLEEEEELTGGSVPKSFRRGAGCRSQFSGGQRAPADGFLSDPVDLVSDSDDSSDSDMVEVDNFS